MTAQYTTNKYNVRKSKILTKRIRIRSKSTFNMQFAKP